MIFSIAVFIAIMIVSMLTGNEMKEKLIIVKSELDITKELDTQFASFDVIEITKNESQRLGDSVVRNLEELVGKRIAMELPVGSPIPQSLLLSEGDKAGEFASKMPENRTYYRFVGGVSQLPPGVGEGDKIDVGVLYEENKERIINLFMKDVVIGSVSEADILVNVTQVEHYQLTLAALEGQFILQLPGRKNVDIQCTDLTVEEVGKVDCYYEDSEPRKITVEEVREIIKNGAKERVYSIPVEEVQQEETPSEEFTRNGGSNNSNVEEEEVEPTPTPTSTTVEVKEVQQQEEPQQEESESGRTDSGSLIDSFNN